MAEPKDSAPADEFVVLRRSDVDALMEEWGDLNKDPFWRPVAVTRERKPKQYGPESETGFSSGDVTQWWVRYVTEWEVVDAV